MSKVNMWEAKTNLSKLVEEALNGEEVIITNRDKPLVRLVPIQQSKGFLGLFEGKIWVSDDFNNTLPEGWDEYA